MADPTLLPDAAESASTSLVLFVPALADPSKPTLAELAAPGVLDISCDLIDGGLEITVDQSTKERRKYCSKDSVERLGTAKFSAGDLQYTADPQNPSSAANKAYATLLPGLSGFLVIRTGKELKLFPHIGSGDIVDVYSIDLGKRVFLPPAEDEELTVKQVTAGVARLAEDYKLTA